MATNRILVQDSVYDEFVTKFVENVKKLVVSNGMNEDSDIGPLINERAVQKVLVCGCCKWFNSCPSCWSHSPNYCLLLAT